MGTASQPQMGEATTWRGRPVGEYSPSDRLGHTAPAWKHEGLNDGAVEVGAEWVSAGRVIARAEQMSDGRTFVYVRPEARGQGIGTILLRALAAKCPGKSLRIRAGEQVSLAAIPILERGIAEGWVTLL